MSGGLPTPEGPLRTSQWSPGRRRLLRLVAGLGLLALALPDLLSLHSVVGGRDALRLYLPLRTFLARELAAGRFPTWFPFDGLGTSFVGSVGAPLQPFSLLALWVGPAASITLQAVAEQGAAGVGAFLLARALGSREPGRWLAAVGYAGSGYVLSVIDNLPYHTSAATLPWVALAAEGVARAPRWSRGALLGATLALTFWGGDVQAGLLQALFAVAVIASHGRKQLGQRARALAVAAVGGAGLVAPMLGPAWSTAIASGRRSGLTLDKALVWSLHPVRLVELVIGPLFPPGTASEPWGFPNHLGGYSGQWFASSEFAGAVVVLAALAAIVAPGRRRIRALYGGTLALAVLLALGRWGGLYGVLHRVVPLWHAFRYPEKLMPWALLALAVLAGAGIEELKQRRTSALLVGLTVGAGALALWASPERVASLCVWLRPDLGAPEEGVSTLVALSARVRALAALLLLLVLAATRWRTPGPLPWVAVGLAVTQAAWTASALVSATDDGVVEVTPSFVRVIRDAGSGPNERVCSWPAGDYTFTHPERVSSESRRALSELQALLPDHPARFGLGALVAYQPGLSQQMVDACLTPPLCGTTCTRRMGARWAVLTPGLLRIARSEPTLRVRSTLEDPQLALVEDLGARALVSTPGVHFVPTERVLAEAMNHSVHTIPEALMVGTDSDLPPQNGVRGFSRPAPGDLRADLELSTPTAVIVAEQLGAGWSARLDGLAVPIERADIALAAIRVPAGHHALRLLYTPPGWPLAWVLFVLGLVAVVAGAWRERSRSRLQSPTVSAAAAASS